MASSFLGSVSATTDSYVSTIAALQAEKAALKQQNESLEIRLAAAHDKIASLQQFCEGETSMRRTAEASLQEATTALKKATDFSEHCKRQWHSVAHMHAELRQELIRRGADDPSKPKPPCDTAFAALQVVCKQWDREECFADLRKQRAEHLRRIAALKSGRELMMDDVVKAMNEDGHVRMMADFDASLHHVLCELREQLSVIFESFPAESAHEEWFKFPLRMFTLDYVSDMEDSDSMEEDNA
jgi:chromosome segregation ATPase